MPLGVVLGVAVGVGVAGDVEPVPAPALAVVRRGEQAVDQPLVGVGRVVGEERRRLPPASAAGRCRSNVGPADERAPVGLGRERQARALAASASRKASIGDCEPLGVLHRGQRRRADRLERPEGLLVVGDVGAAISGSGRAVLRPRSIQARIVARSVRRQLPLAPAASRPLSRRSTSRLSSRLARDDRRAAVAALGDQPHQPQVEVALVLLLLAVALEAVRLEDRPDVLLRRSAVPRRSR